MQINKASIFAYIMQITHNKLYGTWQMPWAKIEDYFNTFICNSDQLNETNSRKFPKKSTHFGSFCIDYVDYA